ncbi:MAG: caspase family protein [Flavobacteriales bacterium]|nr:caspase family protein [Flavobacteriales bacterium]
MSKKIALCIGINDYPGTGSDLSGCVNDANDWAAELKLRGFSVAKLLDSQATRKGILDAMGNIIKSATKGDSIVFQYSGHGTYIPDQDGDEPDGTDECLVPYDINTKGPVTDDELNDLFNSRAYGVKLVFFSDSCHSGTVSKFAPITTPPTITGGKAPQRKVRFLPPATFLKKGDLSKLGVVSRAIRGSSPPGRHGCLLISGCQDYEYSYDAWFQNRPNGAFTYVALKALKALKKDATYRQWYIEIKKGLPSQQYPQSPNLYGTKSMKRWKALQ